MSINKRIILITFSLFCFAVSKSQDTIYKIDSNVIIAKVIRVTDNVIDFAPYDFQDGPTHEIKRSKVALIVYESGKREVINGKAGAPAATPPPPANNTATVPAPASGNNSGTNANNKPSPANSTTTKTNPTPPKANDQPKPPDLNSEAPCAAFDPTAKFQNDASIQLCGFTSSKDAHYKGQKQNNFYLNDPDKKFVTSKQITCVGLDFSWMKLINDAEIEKAADLKQKEMSRLCFFMNDAPSDYFLADKFGNGKKVKVKMDKLKTSWKNLDADHWVCSDDYKIDAGKIPAIISQSTYDGKDGLGAVFIVEKLSKPLHTVSGYWVIFGFDDKKVLIIDHIVYTDVTPQIGETAWWLFWKNGLTDANVFHPFDIEKYYDLEKKGQFEKVCGN